MDQNQLLSRIKELEEKLAQVGGHVGRGKIEHMSAEVVDSNPYR